MLKSLFQNKRSPNRATWLSRCIRETLFFLRNFFTMIPHSTSVSPFLFPVKAKVTANGGVGLETPSRSAASLRTYPVKGEGSKEGAATTDGQLGERGRERERTRSPFRLISFSLFALVWEVEEEEEEERDALCISNEAKERRKEGGGGRQRSRKQMTTDGRENKSRQRWEKERKKEKVVPSGG